MSIVSKDRYFCLIHARSMLNFYPEQKMCDRAKGLKLLEEKSSGNTRRLAFLYPPVGRDLGSGICSFGRQCVHWSHWLCSKEYPQKVPSPPHGRRGLRPSFCRKVGVRGGMKQPFFWAVTLFYCEPHKS